MDATKKLSFVSLCFFACAGLCSAVLAPFLLPWWLLCSFIVIAASLFCFRCNVAKLSAVFLAGIISSASYCHYVMVSLLPQAEENKEQIISGYIIDFPEMREHGWTADFYAHELSGKIKLNFNFANKPKTDCVYRLSAKLKRPRGLNNFDLFDRQAWLLQSGYRATGNVRDVLSCDGSAPNTLLRWREKIAKNIQAVPMSNYARSTLLALLIGSYADIEMTQWQLLRDSGTIHILSVSGLHIVLAAGIAYFIFFHLSRYLVLPVLWWPAAFWGGIASLLSSVIYALLAGFSVPTVRSLIMVASVVVQSFFYKSFAFGTAFMLALFLVLLVNPLSVFSSGFWFSFLATGFLLLIAHGRFGKRNWLVESIKSQCLIFFLMAPPLLYIYGRMPLLSLPLNFFAIPWMSFLSLPLAFAGLVFMPLSSFISAVFFKLSAWSLDVYWQVLQWCVSFCKGWTIDLAGANIFSVVLAIFGISLWLLPRSVSSRYFSILLCLPLLFPQINHPAKGTAEMTVLDVGQGLAVVVRTAHHLLVYDTGDHFSDRFDSGRDIVTPFLRNYRADKISMLMVSHSDKDHAGGISGLLQALPAQQLLSGTPELLHTAYEFNQCRAGMHWHWDGVDFRVLAPDTYLPEKTNNRCCILMIDNGSKRILLTGDSEKMVEQSLIFAGVDISADVLLVPHHGSKTSSSIEFIRAVAPSLAVVSSGFNNKFHHPNADVLRRYQTSNIQVLNTAQLGAVRVNMTRDKVISDTALCPRVVFFRGFFLQQRFWRDAEMCRQYSL